MKLNSIENIYAGTLALIFYSAGGATEEKTIAIGCLACFGFIPSYRVLAEGVKYIPLRSLAFNASIGGLFIFLMQFLLREEKPTDMTVLFASSYVASKGFRFFVVGLINIASRGLLR